MSCYGPDLHYMASNVSIVPDWALQISSICMTLSSLAGWLCITRLRNQTLRVNLSETMALKLPIYHRHRIFPRFLLPRQLPSLVLMVWSTNDVAWRWRCPSVDVQVLPRRRQIVYSPDVIIRRRTRSARTTRLWDRITRLWEC